MAGGTITAVLAVALISGAGFVIVWLGRRMAAGQLDPNVGHMNAHNTTPESWQTAQKAIGEAVRRCGWMWVAAGLVLAVFAPAGIALIMVASGLLVVQAQRASQRLEAVA